MFKRGAAHRATESVARRAHPQAASLSSLAGAKLGRKRRFLPQVFEILWLPSRVQQSVRTVPATSSTLPLAGANAFTPGICGDGSVSLSERRRDCWRHHGVEHWKEAPASASWGLAWQERTMRLDDRYLRVAGCLAAGRWEARLLQSAAAASSSSHARKARTLADSRRFFGQTK